MPESIVKKYYEELGKGRLLGRKCNACGQYTFPPLTRCESCGSIDGEDIDISGKGTLFFLTNSMAPPPNSRFDDLAPFGYGQIQLEEGITIKAIVNNVKLDHTSLREFYEKGPVPVVADIIEVKGLPVLAFKIAQ